MSEDLKKGGSDLTDLKGIVSSLQEEVRDLQRKPKSTSVLRKHTKIHTAFLREFKTGDEVTGIVLKIYDVREIKDPNEAKKYMGICKMECLNPTNGRKFTEENVNYLEFLQNANRVKALIKKRVSTKRIETDIRKGGGGVGMLLRQNQNNESLLEAEHEFEVEYDDETFFLEIMEGAFSGYLVETSPTALNI